MYRLQSEFAAVKRRKDEILYHPEYSRTRRKSLVEMLELESNYHSAALEIPNSGTSMGVTRSAEGKLDSPHILREKVKEIWDWAVDGFNKIYRDNGGLTERFIIDLNQKFEPNNAGYRQDKVLMNGMRYTPPNPMKVPELMGLLVEQINSRKDLSLEQAVQAHFHITRIQPFIDGNKRTARMVQNLLLNYGGYFPILIQQGEREFYSEMLSNALSAFQNREATAAPGSALCLSNNLSNDELNLYHFLVSKERIALDNMENELALSRSYLITFNGVQPGKLIEVKRKLQGFFIRSGATYKTIHPNKEKRTVEITGDISKEQVRTVLFSAVKKLRPSQWNVDVVLD